MSTQATWMDQHPLGKKLDTDKTSGQFPSSTRFLATISRYRNALIVAHDNPDPDAVATGWAIKQLIETCTNMKATLIAGGQITRAENRHMVESLEAPIVLVDTPQADTSTAVILVDCGVDATHHLATQLKRTPTAVIDHHCSGSSADVEYFDIRPEVAASASIAASYLQEQGVTPSAKLATALLYALKTETRGGEHHFTKLDREMLTWLTKYADPAVLSKIEDAPLTREYYRDMALAMNTASIYGNTAICMLPHAAGPEIVGEVADFLIRCEGITSVLCAAAIDADVLISARTIECDRNATELLQTVLDGLGEGGGHQHRAGGKISDVSCTSCVPDDVVEELTTRWLTATCCESFTVTPLVAHNGSART